MSRLRFFCMSYGLDIAFVGRMELTETLPSVSVCNATRVSMSWRNHGDVSQIAILNPQERIPTNLAFHFSGHWVVTVD